MSRVTQFLAFAGVLGLAATALASPAAGPTSASKPAGGGTAATQGTAAAKPAAPAVKRTPGVDLVDAVIANYKSLTSYDVEGSSSMNMGLGGQMQVIDVPFRLAGAKPSRLRTEIESPMMPFSNFSDGSKTWVYLPRERQYTVKDATPAATGGDDVARLSMGTPLQRYFTLREGLVSARVVGKGPAMLGDERVPCTIVEVQYSSPDTTRFKLSPNTYWIDPKRNLVLRDSLQVRMAGADGSPVMMTTVVTFKRFDLNPKLADTTFTFQPPEGARQVTTFDMPGMSEPTSPFVGKPAQEIALTDVDGKKQKLSALKGKVVLLDFWATWCGPCRRELPVIAKLHQELASKGLAVVAVNVGEPRATVSAFLKKNAFELPVWLDTESAVSAAYEARSIPTLVVIDRTGKVSAYKVGVRQESDLRALLTEAGLD